MVNSGVPAPPTCSLRDVCCTAAVDGGAQVPVGPAAAATRTQPRSTPPPHAKKPFGRCMRDTSSQEVGVGHGGDRMRVASLRYGPHRILHALLVRRKVPLATGILTALHLRARGGEARRWRSLRLGVPSQRSQFRFAWAKSVALAACARTWTQARLFSRSLSHGCSFFRLFFEGVWLGTAATGSAAAAAPLLAVSDAADIRALLGRLGQNASAGGTGGCFRNTS